MGLHQRQSINNSALFAALIASLLITVCNRNGGLLAVTPPLSKATAVLATTSARFSDRQILSDFADKVVVPTFQTFAGKASALSTAINTFTQHPNRQTLQAARTAWVEARSPWEQSECFGFGPVKDQGFDANLDTWPIDENDLKQILASGDKLTPSYVERLRESDKGFHVIEYLLFGTSGSKQPTDFTPRELEFLNLLGTNFVQTASNMTDSWVKGTKDSEPTYREVIATAGAKDNTTYPTLQAAAQEMIGGMLDSLDEVANKKIAKPFEHKDPDFAESRFSFNTLNDIKNNVRGSQNVYLGHFQPANTNGLGLTTFVAKIDPNLDLKVKQQFQAALDALNKIPAPFEKSALDPQAAGAIKAAQDAVNTLHDTLEKEVKPLLGSAS
ncbi:MAG: hypothetical protein JO235_03635 [Chroococcidiopsidaceae cyanobacterium CP_BM_RX_35]|nr:hypothetical protein [Chroococcidiopsidaceae cyanobacterium CP_BM_RX_35]